VSGKDSADEVEQRTIHGLTNFRDKDVVEIGCGDGRMTWLYAHHAKSVLALDIEEEEITAAIEATPDELKSKVTFKVADVVTDELPKDAYDLALFSHSL